MTEKRPRGRPPGEGKKDGTHLAKIADIMIARKMKKPTTAMKAYIAQLGNVWTETDSTLIRRWQVKWKEKGEEFLRAAQKREEPVRRPAESSYGASQIFEAMSKGSFKHQLALLQRPETLHQIFERSREAFQILEKNGALDRATRAVMLANESPLDRMNRLDRELYKSLNPLG